MGLLIFKRKKQRKQNESFKISKWFSSVQLLSCIQLFETPRTAARQTSLSITNSQSLLKLIHWVSDAIQPSHPLSSPSPPVFNLPQHQSFPMSQLFAPGGQSFSFSISPSNEYTGLVSLRIDWYDLLTVQGILKSLLQHHSSKASTLWHSTFVIVQLLNPYMTTRKNHSFDKMGLCGQSNASVF